MEKSFKEEEVKLKSVFGKSLLTIEHVGSTSIPSVLAKPIIDIGVIVPSLEDAKTLRKKLEEIGYVMKENDNNREERLFFTKGPEELRTHYLHIGEKGSGYIEDMIRFKDYLNNHETKAKEYSDFKERLATTYSNNREEYTKRKEALIKSILAKT